MLLALANEIIKYSLAAVHRVRKWQILLKKSFWDVERKFLEPLMRFTRSDVRGPYRFIQNQPRTSVVALKSDVAAGRSKGHLDSTDSFALIPAGR